MLNIHHKRPSINWEYFEDDAVLWTVLYIPVDLCVPCFTETMEVRTRRKETYRTKTEEGKQRKREDVHQKGSGKDSGLLFSSTSPSIMCRYINTPFSSRVTLSPAGPPPLSLLFSSSLLRVQLFLVPPPVPPYIV